MAYVEPNFKTKKALKEAVANGEEVCVFSPGPYGNGRTAQALIDAGAISPEGERLA